MNLVILGPKHGNKGQVGGIVVSFELILNELDKCGIKYVVIDTNKKNYFNPIFALIIIYLKILLFIPKTKVFSLHGTANDYRYIAPYVIFLGQLFNKKVSLRKFAGNFIQEYEKSTFISKKLIEYSLKNANIIFFQTKYLVDYFSKFNINTAWFPTVRNKPKLKRSKNRKFEKKFIFLGHLRKEKGIQEILEVSKILDDDFIIDLYGPIHQDEYTDTFWRNFNKVSYKGELKFDEVIDVLSNYDVLLLPTFWEGEGYPGVIVEALSVGLPIIATNLKGIKEMIDEKSSILIEPKSINELKNAIESFNVENYLEKSDAALKQFDNFNSDIQVQVFFERIGI